MEEERIFQESRNEGFSSQDSELRIKDSRVIIVLNAEC